MDNTVVANHFEVDPLREFLLQAKDLDSPEAESLLAATFPLGHEQRDDAHRLLSRIFVRRERQLQKEPGWAEREEFKKTGYENLRGIGNGGGGSVYLAKQQKTGQLVAVKFLGWSLGPGGAAHMRHEIEQLSKIRHPDLVKLYQADETTSGRPYFIMEYVDGSDIVTQCNRLGWDLKKRLELMVRVAEAVANLNRQGVIHRDLKPANILLSKDGHPKIIDLGLAQSVYADWRDEWLARMLSEPALSEDFAPPEQHSIERVDTSADCFALGRILFKLLTGELCDKYRPVAPSQARISTDARILGFSNDVTLQKYYRGDLDAIVLKATSPEPGRRYRQAGELAEDLRRFLEDRPVSAVPNSRAYEVRLFARRNQYWVAAVVVFLILLIASASYAWREKNRAEQANLAAQDALREERAAKLQAERARREAEENWQLHQSSVGSLASSIRTLTQRLYRSSEQALAAERDQWIALFEEAKASNGPESMRLTLVGRAMNSIEQTGGNHPRRDELERQQKALASVVEKSVRSGGPSEAGSAVWNLNTLVQIALFEMKSVAKPTQLETVTGTVRRTIPFLNRNLGAYRVLRETVCGSDPEQKRLRSQIPEFHEVCR